MKHYNQKAGTLLSCSRGQGLNKWDTILKEGNSAVAERHDPASHQDPTNVDGVTQLSWLKALRFRGLGFQVHR